MAVVVDEKQDGLGAEVKPEVYDPHTQDSANSMSVIVRTAGDPTSVLPAVGREVAAVDRGVALFQTPPADPLVFVSVAGILAAAGALASFVPARRAARVDPTISLRTH